MKKTKQTPMHEVDLFFVCYRTMSAAGNLFQQHARSEAQKVLVIITDMQSDSISNTIKTEAKALESKGVTVIPVAFGSKASPTQLEITTPNKGNLIKTDKDIPPKTLAKDIMNKILKGLQNFIKCLCVYIYMKINNFT